MEALYKEAVLCTQGEDKARTLLESICLQTEDSEDNRWVEYASTHAHLAVIDFQTRAVEVDGCIEANRVDLPNTPFISQALRTLEALEANLTTLCSDLSKVTPLFQEAITKGDALMVELFIQAGVDPSAEDNRAIQLASENGHLSVVDRLLQDARVDPSAQDNAAIREASDSGHLPVVDRLLQDARVDPSARDNYAIQIASACGHIAVVDRLLQDARVDPSAKNNLAILLASANGHLPVVDRLLQDVRVDPSAENNTAIRGASNNGHLPVVDRLLQDARVITMQFELHPLRVISR